MGWWVGFYIEWVVGWFFSGCVGNRFITEWVGRGVCTGRFVGSVCTGWFGQHVIVLCKWEGLN